MVGKRTDGGVVFLPFPVPSAGHAKEEIEEANKQVFVLHPASSPSQSQSKTTSAMSTNDYSQQSAAVSSRLFPNWLS